jgi:D-galactarolactone cycloisomerase
MKITRIETFQLEAPLERPFGWSQGRATRRQTGIVRVTTDTGTVGWGEGATGPAASVIHETLAPRLLGQDPCNRAGLWQAMFAALYNDNTATGYGANAISAVDIALWDITGKATGLSICDLLGGRVRNRVAVYATGLYYTVGEMDGSLVAEARGYVEAGFKGMKTKVGGLALEADVHRVAAIREAIGPDTHLMIDANQAFNAATAIRLGHRLAEHDIFWFEEPVNARDIEGYLQVKAALPMAIAGGEAWRTRFDFKDFLARRAIDVAQPDVGMTGGISELKNISVMANAFGIQVAPHVWGSPIMIAATLHVAATLPACPPARTPQPYEQEPVMEFDQTPNAIRETLCGAPITQQHDGFVAVPPGCGLGVEVDEAALDRLCVGYAASAP